MSNALISLTNKLASRFDMGEGRELIDILKATAFKGDVTDAQMTALMVVANQYSLNPWTKEIYAFPDKKNGIVPVVGVDGWSRIINDNPNFDGMEFRFSENMIRMDGAKSDAPEWTECIIYRKDRKHPIVVREYLDEVYRAPFKSDKGYTVDGPWQSHPKRFSRHKAMIQCARLAFGFVGIYDQDEAERIAEFDIQIGEVTKRTAKQSEKIIEMLPQDVFDSQSNKWRDAIKNGKPASDLIAWIEAKGCLLTEDQKITIDAWAHEGE